MGYIRLNDFSGTQNQYSSPLLLPANQAEILLNISQGEVGTLSHRLGTELYNNVVSGSTPVLGLHMYTKNDGTYYFHMVESGNLRVSNQVTNTWDLQASSFVSASSTVEFQNFAGRHYLIGSGATEYLSYATESGVVNTVPGNIEGRYLASNNAVLAVTGGTTYPHRTFWSNSNSDTFATTINYVDSSYLPTGIGAFGNGKTIVIFSENSYLTVDTSTGTSDEVYGIGAKSHRSIQNVMGYLVFFGGSSFYILTPDASRATDVGQANSNDLTTDAILDQVAGGNARVAASGTIKGRYWCAVGNLNAQVRGQTINSCILEYNVFNQTWISHSYNTGSLASVFATFINSSNQENLYAGSTANKAIYKMEVEGIYTDDNSSGTPVAVNAVYRRSFNLSSATRTGMVYNTVDGIYIKYYAASTLTVKTSTNGGTYTTLSTVPSYTSTAFGTAYIPWGSQMHTMGLEISGSGEWHIYDLVIVTTELTTPSIKHV